MKARKKLEDEINDLQSQVDSLSKSKKEVRGAAMSKAPPGPGCSLLSVPPCAVHTWLGRLFHNASFPQVESKYMTALKQNNELSSKTEEDEEELERLTEKNRQLLKEVLHQAGELPAAQSASGLCCHLTAERKSRDVVRYSVGRFGSLTYRTAWHVGVWSCGLVWNGFAWDGMMWYDVVWNGLVWYDVEWYGMAWYCMVWYGMV